MMMKTVGVVALLFVASVALPAPPQQVAPEVRGELFEQLLASRPDLLECVKGEAGGEEAAREEVTAGEMDLNGDGRPEFEVGLAGRCACGEHNCSTWVFRKVRGGYELLLEGDGFSLSPMKSATNGYLDLLVETRDSAAAVVRTHYKFDGREYREFRSDLVSVETGEAKPAQRRVRFGRGRSSATVRGRVSPGFPDTYLIGARAGQTVNVRLAAARTAVTFSVMSPGGGGLLIGNVRDWGGTLRESGDYYILVNTDEGERAYTLTITIR
jgi:hypothetical protein